MSNASVSSSSKSSSTVSFDSSKSKGRKRPRETSWQNHAAGDSSDAEGSFEENFQDGAPLPLLFAAIEG